MSSRARVLIITAFAAAVAALVGGGPGPAVAAAIPPATAPPTPPAPPTPHPSSSASGSTAGNAPVMVVLDASGSMNTADAPGPRIAAAKRAVTRLVSTLPGDARIGLEVYGTGTGSGGAEKAAGCRDIRLVQPVGPVDRTGFVDRVTSIKASGYTPIGESLRRAAAALPAEGPRSIVLVSDGEDTCAPPAPCDVARQLKAQGVDLTVHAIGFKVAGSARSQLQCIARTTGGRYTDANDGGSLGDVLTRQVGDAVRGYATAGTRIAGGDTSGTGPALRPGQYLDTFAHGAALYSDEGTAKFYRLDLAAGDIPYVSATVVGPAVRERNYLPIGVQIELRSLDTNGCGESDVETGSVNSGRVPTVTAVVAPGATGSSESCLVPGPVAVKVQRTGSALAGRPLDVELSYRVERPVAAGALSPPATPERVRRTDVTGTPVPMTAGSSYNNAPALTTGVYRDTITPGEARYVKVHLDWGQELSYSYAAAKQPGYNYANGVFVRSTLANPVREEVFQPLGSTTTTSLFGAVDTQLFTSSPVPVRYRNRESRDAIVNRVALTGDYYLVLTSGFDTTGRSQRIPYTLRLQVTGTRDTGPGDVTRGSAARTATGATSNVNGSQVAGRDDRDPGSGTPVLVAAVTAGVLLLGGLAAGWGARRRRGAGGHTDTMPTTPWDGHAR